jgi:hypothetical protein
VSSAFFISSPIFSSCSSSDFLSTERLGPIEALVGDVVDELVELVDGRLGVVALVLLFQLLEKVLHVLQIVGSHLHGVDHRRVRHRDVVAHLEEEDTREEPREAHRRAERPRHGQTDGGPRLRLGYGEHRVLDGGVHEGGALRGRAEREGAGESIVKPVEAVERPRTRSVRQPPRPSHHRRDHHAGARGPEHDPRRSLSHEAQLAQRDVDGGQDQRRTERPCTYTERATQPDASLGLRGKPSNLVHPRLGGAHPSCRL